MPETAQLPKMPQCVVKGKPMVVSVVKKKQIYFTGSVPNYSEKIIYSTRREPYFNA